MSTIKPGCICLIVDTGTEYDGRVVTAIRYCGEYRWLVPVGTERCGFLWLRTRLVHELSFVPDAWECEAPWHSGSSYVLACCLRPIADPDIDTTEPAADALHDDLIDKLRFTRPEVAA